MCLLQVWQNSEEALLQMVVVVLVRLVAGENTLPAWDHLGTALQLLLVTAASSSNTFHYHYMRHNCICVKG